MATFTYTPDFGASVEVKPSVKTTKFGDGYEQRQSAGINTQPKMWDLKFSYRSDSESAAIVGFLEARAGVENFDWVDINSVSGKYVCRSWNRSKDHAGLNTVTAKFEQVFEP